MSAGTLLSLGGSPRALSRSGCPRMLPLVDSSQLLSLSGFPSLLSETTSPLMIPFSGTSAISGVSPQRAACSPREGGDLDSAGDASEVMVVEVVVVAAVSCSRRPLVGSTEWISP